MRGTIQKKVVTVGSTERTYLLAGDGPLAQPGDCDEVPVN